MAKGYLGVPMSYTPVEYIESSGTQYIDTGFKPNNNTKVEAQMGGLASTGGWGHIFGARNSAGVNEYAFSRSDTGIFRSDYGASDERKNFPSEMDLTGTFTVDKNKNVMTINSSSVTNGVSSFQVSFSLYLFAMHNGESADPGFPVSCKLYYLKIYDDNTLVRDYIPALDDNNVACLYEQVERKFYYNKGTGIFTAGSATGQPVYIDDRARRIKNAYVGVHASYTPLEYIESTGTQYINTGVLPYQTQLEIQFAYTSLENTTYVSGCYNDNNNRYGVIANRTANNDICCGDKDNNYYSLDTANTNVHTIIYNNSANEVVYDNVVKGTISDLTARATNPFTLFAYNSSIGAANFSNAKLYYCKITDKSTNTLIRDFIPVANQDNVACLYEQVEGKFYYNQGSGTFVAGSAAGSPVSVGEIARKIVAGWVGVQDVARTIFTSFKKYDYIDAHGNVSFLTGIHPKNTDKLEFEFDVTYRSSDNVYRYWCNTSGSGYYIKLNLQYDHFIGWAHNTSSGGRQINISSAITQNVKHKAILENGKCYYYQNGVLVKSDTLPNPGTGTSTGVFTLFGNNATQNDVHMRVGQVKYYESGTLTHLYIPGMAKDRVCFYDEVTGDYLYPSSSSTGTINVGNW